MNEQVDCEKIAEILRQEILQTVYLEHGIDPNDPDAENKALRIIQNPIRSAKVRGFLDSL